MNNEYISLRLHYFFAFFIFTFLYLLSGLLYSWKTPAWLNLIPNAGGFRLLMVLEMYFLCCAAFFFSYLISAFNTRQLVFRKVFIISFSPLILFLLFLIFHFKLHELRATSYLIDTLVWASASFFLYKVGNKTYTWFGFLLAFLISGVFFFVPVVKAVFVIIFRTTVLAIFCVLYFKVLHSPSCSGLDEAITLYGISNRESDVLTLLFEGKTNEEIAKTLCISLSTVKSHISSIFQKTGARNRSEVAYLCGKQINHTYG